MQVLEALDGLSFSQRTPLPIWGRCSQQRGARSQVGAEKADMAPGSLQATPASFLRCNLPIQGNQHSIILLEHASFCCSSWCLSPFPPPADRKSVV